METVYEAVESAGMTLEGLRGTYTNVCTRFMVSDYDAMLLWHLDVAPACFTVGTSRAILSNRTSFFLDWHETSVIIDTACSSSLVAIHMAIQTSRPFAQVSRVWPWLVAPMSFSVQMLYPGGLGRMWDQGDSNGYAHGDSVAAIVLKNLSAALEDNDHIEISHPRHGT